MKSKLLYSVIILLSFLILACGGQKEDSTKSTSSAQPEPQKKEESTASTSNSNDAKPASSNRKGRLIYKQYCVICHGIDGTLGVSDATDLTQSTTTLEERLEQITNGKGLMTPYKDILSEDQILAVAEYVVEFRQ